MSGTLDSWGCYPADVKLWKQYLLSVLWTGHYQVVCLIIFMFMGGVGWFLAFWGVELPLFYRYKLCHIWNGKSLTFSHFRVNILRVCTKPPFLTYPFVLHSLLPSIGTELLFHLPFLLIYRSGVFKVKDYTAACMCANKHKRMKSGHIYAHASTVTNRLKRPYSQILYSCMYVLFALSLKLWSIAQVWLTKCWQINFLW